MTQVVLKTQKLKDDNLMQYATHIITEMRKAVDIFPEPTPGLNGIETALAAFRLSATEAAYRDIRAIRVRDEKRKELEYLLRELSKYVDTVANQNETIILASGFNLKSNATSYAGAVPKATRLQLEPQEVGSRQIKVKVNRWKGARMYRFEWRKKGETEWAVQFSTRSTCILEGLEMFQEYEFRASYLGINPEPNYSDIVASYVV